MLKTVALHQARAMATDGENANARVRRLKRESGTVQAVRVQVLTIKMNCTLPA